MINPGFDVTFPNNDLETYGIFSKMDQNALSALRPFQDHLDLRLNDLMSIRDISDFAGRPDDPALALMLMVMFSTLEEGSLCLDLDICLFSARFPYQLRSGAERYGNDFLQHLSKGCYDTIITRDDSGYLPLVAESRRGKTLLYFQKYHAHETRLKTRMEAFLATKIHDEAPEGSVESVLQALYSPALAIRTGKAHTPLTTDPVQLQAIRLSLKSSFTIISGGPGTGKTSLMVNILRALVRTGTKPSQIILGAPTGRAAQRMTEAILTGIASVQEPSSGDLSLRDLKGATLHKILKYSGHGNDFHHRASNPLKASVVVLDEVSMVDLVMLEKFLQAVDPSTTRLIFLGDKDQLPSVEAGAVFAEMIPDGDKAEKFRERLVVLENVYRSGTKLLGLARSINSGIMPDVQDLSMEEALGQGMDQWSFVPCSNAETLYDTIKKWVGAFYANQDSSRENSFKKLVRTAGETFDLTKTEQGHHILEGLFGVTENARILTIVRNGPWGCIEINALIGRLLVNITDPGAQGREAFFSGQQIMVTRNDYSKELFNGDTGIILKDASGSYKAFFRRSGAFIDIPVDTLTAWEPAFAMTVHKSQGSEFNDVLLVLPDDREHRLLSREIVYTGITRARNRVIIHGSTQSLATALGRKIERQSGLFW